MYRFSALDNTSRQYAQYAAFLSGVFNKSDLFTTEYLSWQYGDNPVGKAVGYDAWFNDELVGHYASLPVSFIHHNREVKGVLALNVATDAAHQGKGLFTKLSGHTYELAQQLGYEFVIAVPNANSTPGFVRKYGFTLLTQLQVYMGLGSISTGRQEASFKLDRSEAYLKWRMARPDAQYFVSAKKNENAVYARTDLPLLYAQMTGYDQAPYPAAKLKKMPPFHFTLWIGYNKNIRKHGIFLPLPEKLKPSPLNLVIKSFSPNFTLPNLEDIDFGLVDFDPY